MKIIVLWDLYWRVWREALRKNITKMKEEYNPDFFIVNWENMSSWKWPIMKHLDEVRKLWVDVITGWNHTLTNEKEIWVYLNQENSVCLRPANFYETERYKISGRWHKVFEKNWKKLLVINLMSWIFMADNVYNPFLKANEILSEYNLDDLDWVVVDFHRETTSESMWMWIMLDWKASLVFWTHTHVQTNDDQILPNWTGFITDIWFVWPRNSVIWVDFSSIERSLLTWLVRWKKEQSLSKEYVINWLFVEIEDKKCVKIQKLRIEN